MKFVYYINLTNGIEALKHYPESKFVRIQSTYCEQKHWEKVIMELDYTFLIDIALGKKVVVIDGGHAGEPRALWQGVSWVQYVLNRRWLGIIKTPYVRGHDCAVYFNNEYLRLSKVSKNRLDYIKKFVIVLKEIEIFTMYFVTKYDGNYAYYRDIIRELYEKT